MTDAPNESRETADTATAAPNPPVAPAAAAPAAPAIPPSYPMAPGYSPVISDDPRRKSPMLASILSLMPGLGQVYVGYYQRGFVHLLTVAGTIGVLNTNGIQRNEALIPAFAFFLVFFWLYNIIDAGRRATFYNYALAGGTDIHLPQEMGAPMAGSVAGGVAAIVVGAVLLGNTLFDISLRWLEDWWPAAIIGFGVYLVLRARQDQAGKSGSDDLAGY